MTTIFGNPGSTELPMLADFPDDFRYVLGLQEAVAVGMADGFAQAAGRVTHVNLHTAPGLGNAMGAIFNAQANKSPLLVTAGQQVRAQITLQANLTNKDATRVPHPYVKWSHEPARAQDVVPARATPAPGGGRIGFPESHPNFRGLLAPAIGPVGQMLEPYDLVLVVGSSVFPYYPYIPGAPLPGGTQLVAITNDPDEAARAPMGDAIVADVRLTLE